MKCTKLIRLLGLWMFKTIDKCRIKIFYFSVFSFFKTGLGFKQKLFLKTNANYSGSFSIFFHKLKSIELEK